MSSSTDKAYAAILEAIAARRFRAGDRLAEERLAREIGVSRTPVREALRRLSAEGLVDFSPNQGGKVSSWSYEDIREIFGLRLLLETYGAENAARKITPEQIAELRELCDEMEQLAARRSPGFVGEISSRNRRLHRVLVEAGGGQRLRRLLPQVIEMPLMLDTYYRYSVEDMSRSMRHHRELTDALSARDGGWAAAVMRVHIEAARNTYLASLNEPGEQELAIRLASVQPREDAEPRPAALKTRKRA